MIKYFFLTSMQNKVANNNVKLTNRLFVLSELEKFEKKEMSIFYNQFKTIEKLKEYRSRKKASERIKFLKDQRMRDFSRIKVVNKVNANCRDSQLRDGRRHPSYKIVFDKKFVKLLNKRRYRRGNLYEIFRTL